MKTKLILTIISIGCWWLDGFTSLVQAGQHGWVVTCESIKYGYENCNVFNSGVMLVNQLSETHSAGRGSCRRGFDWDANNRGIWVNNGCRAEFYVYNANSIPAERTINCESWNYEHARCFAPGITGSEQVSIWTRTSHLEESGRGSCRFGDDWGISRDGIWVANGCRAIFLIRS